MSHPHSSHTYTLIHTISQNTHVILEIPNIWQSIQYTLVEDSVVVCMIQSANQLIQNILQYLPSQPHPHANHPANSLL